MPRASLSSPLLKSAIAALSLSLSACSVVDAVYGPERLRSLEGKKLGELYGSRDLVYSLGFLVVAHHSRSPGLAIIDTGSGNVIDFIAMKEVPVKLTSDSLGNVFVIQEHFPGASAGILNVLSPLYHTTRLDALSSQDANIIVSAGQPLLVQTSKKILSRIRIEAGSLSVDTSFTTHVPPYGAAFVGDDVVFTSNSPEFLFFAEDFGSVSRIDSIPVLSEQDSVPAQWESQSLISYADKLFRVVNNGDSSFIVVLDVFTRNVLQTIHLNFSSVRTSGILDGKLFLLGRGAQSDIPWSEKSDQGVEWIDLQTVSAGGIVVTSKQAGGEISGFTPAGPGKGYVLVERPYESGKTSIRKIFY